MMRTVRYTRRFFLVCTPVAIVVTLCSDRVFAATYYLNPATGKDSNPGTQGSPWKTLDKVVSATGPGDVVNVVGGTYTPSQYTTDGSWILWRQSNAHGTAGKPITIQANPGDTVVFDGQRQPLWIKFWSVTDTAYYVVIKNLEFQHFQPAIVSVSGGGYVAVINCYFHDTYDLTASAVGTGGETQPTHHVIFRGNRFYNIGDPTVFGVQGEPGDHAIYLAENSQYIVVDDNYLEKIWEYGVHGYGHGNYSATSHHWIVRHNTMANVKMSGVVVTSTNYTNIYV